MYGQDILSGISKGTLEILHKIPYPYIERYDFYEMLKFYKSLDLGTYTLFWNADQGYFSLALSPRFWWLSARLQ